MWEKHSPGSLTFLLLWLTVLLLITLEAPPGSRAEPHQRWGTIHYATFLTHWRCQVVTQPGCVLFQPVFCKQSGDSPLKGAHQTFIHKYLIWCAEQGLWPLLTPSWDPQTPPEHSQWLSSGFCAGSCWHRSRPPVSGLCVLWVHYLHFSHVLEISAALPRLALSRSLSSRSATESHNVGLQVARENNLKIQTAGNYTGDIRVKLNLLSKEI